MGFEFDGEKYKKASTHQKQWGNALIGGMKLIGQERILDLGCGDGVLTRELARRVPAGYVTGIDASSAMIEAASSEILDNMTFKVEDINHINYLEEFDIIFSNAALHWIKDHGRLLSNCRRALKTGGKLHWNFAGAGNCANFYEVVKEVMNRTCYKGSFGGFEWPWYMPAEEEYRNRVKMEKFTEFEVWLENADRYFEDKEAMIGWIDQPSIVPFLARIENRDLKRRFRTEVVEKMLERTLQRDGRCFETFRRINVYAVK